MPVLLAVAASVGWGAADFFGGSSRRKTPVFVVLAISQAIGFALLVPVLVARGVPPPGNPRLLFACLAGIGVTVELRIIFLAISHGDAFITAPVGALGAAIAVTAGLIGGDRLDLAIGIGMLLALAGAGLSARSSTDRRPAGRTPSMRSRAALCLGAATGVAVALGSLHAAGRVDPYWTAALVDVSTLVPAGLAAVVGQGRRLPRRLPGRSQLPPLAVGAAAGVAGDLAYAVASRAGALSIVSALASLYPLTTVALGVTLQRRRPTAPQGAGIFLALVGAAVLGAATQ